MSQVSKDRLAYLNGMTVVELLCQKFRFEDEIKEINKILDDVGFLYKKYEYSVIPNKLSIRFSSASGVRPEHYTGDYISHTIEYPETMKYDSTIIYPKKARYIITVEHRFDRHFRITNECIERTMLYLATEYLNTHKSELSKKIGVKK